MSNRPIPTIDEASKPFFAAAKQCKLLLKFCEHCHRWLHYDREVCDVCFAHRLTWRESTGKGVIYSFIIQHQVMHPGFADEVPYNVTVVELDEGLRIRSNIVGAEASNLAIGRRVEVVFEALDQDVTVPLFRLVG